MLALTCLAGLAAAASAMELVTGGEHMIELLDAPYHVVGQVEGIYTPWDARYINGPVYRRTDTSYKFTPTIPTFMGAFCGHTYDGPPTDWCIAACDEGHMMNTQGLLLPCGGTPPDGTLCPVATAADPPKDPPQPQDPPPPPPAICEVLAHARRYTEAGGDIHRFPEPRWWRFRGAMGGWLDADAMATGAFVVAPRSVAVPPPGERLRMRKDGTIRSGARPEFCLGADKGRLQEGQPLIFWECGTPPHKHELFALARRPSSQSAEGAPLRAASAPGLCLVVPGGTRDLLEVALPDQVGPPALLGSCDGGAAGVPLQFAQTSDGTIRVATSLGLCLRTGLDRPHSGAPLRLERCSTPRALPAGLTAPTAEPLLLPEGRAAEGAKVDAKPAADPGASHAAPEILGALEALQAKLDSSMDRLEDRMGKVEMLHTDVRQWMLSANTSGSEPPEYDNRSAPSCRATGGKGPCTWDEHF